MRATMLGLFSVIVGLVVVGFWATNLVTIPSQSFAIRNGAVGEVFTHQTILWKWDERANSTIASYRPREIRIGGIQESKNGELDYTVIFVASGSPEAYLKLREFAKLIAPTTVQDWLAGNVNEFADENRADLNELCINSTDLRLKKRLETGLKNFFTPQIRGSGIRIKDVFFEYREN